MTTFTPKELEISNKSYTNKDFEAIYLETLELAEKISKRFSPVNANEADPFIVLLKLVSAVTDKINYNVDKNILERFLLSCTQQTSMRDLTSRLGYNMRYYHSAETSVLFKYNFTGAEGEPSIINIPAFSIVTNANDLQYITIENTKIDKAQGISTAVNVIQGKLKDLEILGSKVIQLQNLNANNRLYLPEVMIAENGISINNTSYSDVWQTWKKSDNLNTEIYGSLVYKFGFDSVKNLPYIEFPEWIADIINDGLSIKYLVTDGNAGNVAAKELTTIIRSSSDDTINDEDIIVINYSSASNGADPETIDEAYKNFKKVIGTFDTLVTCRDYANAIYNLIDEYRNPYVSNVQVGDRRNDINYSCNVISMSDLGTQTKTIISSENDKPQISPYDLCVYGLNPLYNTSYIAADDTNGYNKSYNLLQNNTSNLYNIKLRLNDLKTVSHTYKEIKNDDIGYIQNNYYLTATINTAKKVNILEQNEILINVNNALIQKYNPRTLSFGYEIAFDELLSTIESADPRIKSVSLQEPEQESKIILGDNTEKPLFNSDNTATDELKFILAKNILSGKVELFEYDKDFNYNFYQKNARKILNVVKAKTYCKIPAIPGITNSAENKEPVVTNYTLNENETIQFLAPKLHTKVTYPCGIDYNLKLTEASRYIPANCEYLLKKDEELVFTYLDNNDNRIIDVYGAGDIIKPNFDLKTTDYRLADLQTPTLKGVSNALTNEYQNTRFFTLKGNEAVEYKELIFDHLNTYKKCYWLTNQPNNQILWKEETNSEIDAKTNDVKTYTYILEDGEYFYYSDANLTSLYVFGSGTRLKLTSKNDNEQENWTHSNYINVDDIDVNGLEALGDAFIGKAFNQDISNPYSLDIFENEIITITSGDILQVMNSKDAFEIPDNNFTTIPEWIKIYYKFQGDGESFNALPDRSTLNSDAKWSIRALLDLNVGPNKQQVLVGKQEIYLYPGFYNEDSKRYEYSDSDVIIRSEADNDKTKIFETTSAINLSGGENINLQFMNLDLTYKCPSFLIFEKDSNNNLQKIDDKFYTTAFDKATQIEGTEYEYKVCEFNVSSVDYNESIENPQQTSNRMFMVYASNLDENKKLTLNKEFDPNETITLWSSKEVKSATWKGDDNDISKNDIQLISQNNNDIFGFTVIAKNATVDDGHENKLKKAVKITENTPGAIEISIPKGFNGNIVINAAPFHEGKKIGLALNTDSAETYFITYDDANVGITESGTGKTHAFEFTVDTTNAENDTTYYLSTSSDNSVYITEIAYHLVCTITCELNGGKLPNNFNNPIIIEPDQKEITLPNPEKTDNIFGGWYTDMEFTNAFNTNAILSNNIKLYAKWVQNGSQTKTFSFENDATGWIATGTPIKMTFGSGKQGNGWRTDSAVNTVTFETTEVYTDITNVKILVASFGSSGVTFDLYIDDTKVGTYKTSSTNWNDSRCVKYDGAARTGKIKVVATSPKNIEIGIDEATITYTPTYESINISENTLIKYSPIYPLIYPVISNLHNGINIIEVKDNIDGSNVQLCEKLLLNAQIKNAQSEEEAKEQLLTISAVISNVKIIKGLNPALGIKEDDNIVEYMKENFAEQFKEFFICADLDQAKQIDISKDYPLASPYAFYDSNNIANKWTLCKIDFTKSDIKIAKSSMYN